MRRIGPTHRKERRGMRKTNLMAANRDVFSKSGPVNHQKPRTKCFESRHVQSQTHMVPQITHHMTEPMGPKRIAVHVHQDSLHQWRIYSPFFQFLSQEANCIQMTFTRQAWFVSDLQQKMVGGTSRKVPDRAKEGRE